MSTQTEEPKPVLTDELVKQLGDDLIDDTTWEQQEDSEGFKVFTKKTNLHPTLLAFKYKGFLENCKLEPAVDLLHTKMVERHQEWNDTYVGGQYYHKFSNEHNIQYWEYKVGWPLANRDFLVERRKIEFQDGVLIIDKSVEFEKHKNKKDNVRCILPFNVRYLKEKDNGVVFYYMNLTDIGGVIPYYLVNVMNPKTSLKEIHHIQKIIQNKH